MIDELQKEDIKLSDIIDLNILQKFQDTFANSMNIASLAVDSNGPVTNPSNFSEFCMKYTRGSKLGCRRCNECDIKWGELASEKGEPIIYNCHSGLTDFAVPIMLDGKHIASILGGQVLTHEPDEEHFRKLAKNFGINEEEYIDALRKIKIIPYEQVEAAAQLLFVVANSISEMAHKNFKLIEKNKRENLYKHIVETMRSSLDIDFIRHEIVFKLGDLLKADRVAITYYNDKIKNYIFSEKAEYKSSDRIKSPVNINFNNMQGFNEDTRSLHIQGKDIIFNDVEKYLDENNLRGTGTEAFYREFGVASSAALSIHYGNKFLGNLIITFENQRNFTNDEIEFLKAIASQAGVAFHQAELYEKEKKTAEREIILRKIIEITRSSLNMLEVKKQIVEELGKTFKANRCYFRSYDRMQDKFFPPDVEYLSSPEVKSLLNVEPNQESIKYFSDELRKRSKGFYPVFANDELAKNTPLENFMKSSDIKADYAMPIIDGKEGFTWLVLHYSEKDPEFDDDYKNLLETIAFQVDTALRQIKLYNTSKQQTEREILLRKIVESMRSSLDIDNILKFICEEVAKLLNVQRVTVVQLLDSKNYEIYKVRTEYKTDIVVKGLTSSEYTAETGAYWGRNIGLYGKVIAYDNIQESDTPDYFRKCYSDLGVKSMVGFPIKKENNQWGSLVLSEYNEYRHWTEDEINLLKMISNQVYIAIEQSELYNAVQKTAEKEKALRKIMSSSVDNFDLKEVINSIITETCQLFNADRCLFIEQTDSDLGLKNYSEYLSSSEIVSAATNIPEKIVIDAMIKLIKKREIKISKDVTKDKLLKATKHILLDSLSVKSFLVAPVYYGEIDYGAIVLHYVKDYKQFSNEEIDLIKAIAKQSATVIHHAKLYQQIEKNEKYTRTVLNSINDCIITIDDDFIVETCNPAVEIIWGYSPFECIGKPLNLLLNYDCEDQKKSACLTKKSVYGTKKNGEKFPIEVNLSKVITEDKNVILLVIRDITERKRMEQMKNEFVSTVSHELRTPLTSLRGSLGLITSGKMGELSEKIKGLLDIANNNCSRLINLINDILDIEKIEAGKMDFEIKNFELMPLINQAIQLNLQFAQKFNVKINLIKSLDNQLVQVDASRLIQVITNLLSNAIKFSNSDSSVHVSVTQGESNIRISITNFGAEIPQNFKNRVFQKFAQADSSDSRQKGGTGLGLSISKAIIEKLNGNIGFISENNETTFYFELPNVSENIEGI